MNSTTKPAALCLMLFALDAAAVEVEPVIVTATRTAQTVDETLAAVTVITREDIDRQQSQSVQDVLRGLPGISISNNGGMGKTTSVFLRGTESDHLLVLIDGIKAGSPTLGTTAFEHIPVDQIDRIEIVRGPRSSLYGSDAIGGVIQIFTRKGGGETTPYFSIGGGSHSTYNASAGVTGGGDHGWISASASGVDTGGINACRGSNEAGCFTFEPDTDSHDNLSGSLRAGYRFDNSLEIDTHLLRSSSDTEFDGSFVNESETTQQILGGTLRFSPTDIWQLSVALGQSRDDSDNFKDGEFQTRFDTERDSVSWQNDIAIADNHFLVLGVDYLDDSVDSTTDFVVSARDNVGAFAEYATTFGAHDVQLSLREDDNEQFDNHTTGGAAWGYALEGGLRLTASYGTAFKAPTFNELYFPDFGNPDLDPEESRSYEFGLTKDSGWGRWSINLFDTRIDDLISFDATTFLPANVDRTRIRGIEFLLGTVINDWSINTTLTLLDPENRSTGANNGNLLPRRAEESLRVDVDRQFGKYAFGVTLVAQGKRYDDLANTRALDSYATVDLRGEYAFAEDWRVQLRIENLFDEDYETAAFFNQPGLGAFVTLRYQP